MKFLTVFVLAFICMAVFISRNEVEANRHGSNNIVLKDGHLILSTSGRKKHGGDNIIIKEDKKNQCCHCPTAWW